MDSNLNRDIDIFARKGELNELGKLISHLTSIYNQRVNMVIHQVAVKDERLMYIEAASSGEMWKDNAVVISKENLELINHHAHYARNYGETNA